MAKPAPVNREISFGVDEMFFSRTDQRGIILSGNDVFARISGYQITSLKGAAHSLVRHPDMPKAVFRVFWNTVQANKPISAFVKNMAADGSYYWVFATAFPVEGGYLSIRIKPTTSILKLMPTVYQKVSEKEKKDGIDAGVAYLLQILKGEGFDSYDAFMQAAMVAEVTSRAQHVAQLPSSGKTAGHFAADADPMRQKLFEIATRCAATASENDSVSDKLSHFAEMNKILAEKSAFIFRSLQSIDLLSVNMSTAAKRIGANGVTLVAVANGIQRVAGEFKTDLARFNDSASKVQASINGSEFVISTSKLQVDMVDFYVREVLRKCSAEVATGGKLDAELCGLHDMQENTAFLLGLSSVSARKLSEEMLALRQRMQALTADVEQLRATINGLEIIRKTGGIEAAQLRDGGSEFQAHFQLMNKLVRETVLQLATFGESLRHSLQDIDVIVPALNKASGLLAELEALNSQLLQS